MKKILGMLCITVLIVSCNNTNKEVQEKGFSQGKSLIIHGKEYKFVLVEPHPNYRNVWILIPKSDTVKVPVTVNYDYKSGKTTITETVIKID